MLSALDAEIRGRIGQVPVERRVVATSHDAFGYFEQAYGVRFLAPLGLKTDQEPRPDRMAALIEQIRRENVRALFVENMTDPRVIRAIAAETRARIGGRLYSDALTTPDGPAPTYEAMMRANVAAIVAAIA
jgi:zinc/manganese transport system substrate-binding protein